MAESSRPTALVRVGIIESGTLTQERLLPLTEPITLGTAATNTLVIGEGPLTVPLFGVEEQGMRLDPSHYPNARMKRGEADAILAFGVRGRIHVGRVHVLYQLVSAPPVGVTTPTTFDFRPRWFDENDPGLVPSFVAWSGLGLMLAIYVAAAAPPAYVTDLTMLDGEARQIIYTPPPPPPTPVVDKDTATRVVEVHQPQPQGDGTSETIAKKSEKVASPEQRALAEALGAQERRAAMEQRLQGIIGTVGDSSLFVDVDVAMEGLGAEPAGPGRADLDAMPRVGKGDLKAADVHLGTLEGGDAEEIGGGPVVIVAAVDPGGAPDLSTLEPNSDMASVAKTLKRYRGHIRGCYERELKKNSRIEGRIEVGLSLASGRVQDIWMIESLGIPEFDRCVKNRANSWRFDPSVTGDVNWPLRLQNKN